MYIEVKKGKEMRQELRQVFHSSRFVGAILVMLLCYFGYSGIEWSACSYWDVDIRPSSLHQVVGCIFFGGIMRIFPLCSGMPSSITQVEEVRGAFMDLRVIRGSVLHYARTKLSSAFLSGAAAMGIAFALHVITWNIIATPCDITQNDYLAIPFSEDCIYYAWQPVFYSLPIYLWMTAAIAFCGGIWGMVGVTAALYFPDKLLSLSIPFCIYYLWSSNLIYALTGIRNLPHPADLYNDALTMPMVFQSVLAYVLIAALCGVLYVAKLKRRYGRNA